MPTKTCTLLKNRIDNQINQIPENLCDISIDSWCNLLSVVNGKIFGEYLNGESNLIDYLKKYNEIDESYYEKYFTLCETTKMLLTELNAKIDELKYVNHNSEVRSKFFMKTRFGNTNTNTLIKKFVLENEKLLKVQKKFDFCGENRFWSLFEPKIINAIKENNFFWCLPKKIYEVLYLNLYGDIGSIVPCVDFRIKKHISNDEITSNVYEQIEAFFKFIDSPICQGVSINECGELRDKNIKEKFPVLRKMIFQQTLFDDLIVALKRDVIENVASLDSLQQGVYRIEVRSEEIKLLKQEQIDKIFEAVNQSGETWKNIEAIMGVRNLKRDITNKKAISIRQLKLLAKIINVSYDYLLSDCVCRQEVISKIGLTLVNPMIRDYGVSLKEVLLPNCVDDLTQEEKELLWEVVRNKKNWLREVLKEKN